MSNEPLGARAKRVKMITAGGWRYVARVILPPRESKVEWLVEKFPDKDGFVMGEDIAWGLASSQREAEDQATRALNKAIAEATRP